MAAIDWASMTLIASCLTPQAVIVVADRRLTSYPTGAPVDDEACKAVMVGSQVVIAFSGLANLERPPRGQTDLWIVDQLSPPPNRLPEIVERLHEAAEQQFGPLQGLSRELIRHAFVVTGWQKRNHSLEPFWGVLSNALDGHLRWLPRARSRFDFDKRYLGPGKSFALLQMGWPLPAQEARILRRRLSEASDREPHRIASLLASAVRQFARQPQGSAVGEGLLVMVLPRETVSASSGFALQPYVPDSEDDKITFPVVSGPVSYYVPPRGTTGVVYAPHFVSPTTSIADVAIHPRALSAEEVKRSYEEGLRKRG